MDRVQLISLASRVSSLLARRGCWLTHGRSLDLVAHVLGFSAWYEVGACAARSGEIIARELDLTRLREFIKESLGVWIELVQLRSALSGNPCPAQPRLWRTGPPPGIYVTPSWDAANAAVARYTTDTGGADCYADNHLTRSANVVALGQSCPWQSDTGIFATRLHQAPSGTLIVIGPIRLTQFDWIWVAEKVHEACRLVLACGHRVILVIETPREDLLRGDLALTLKSGDYDARYAESALRGTVGAEGALTEVAPFRESRSRPVFTRVPAAQELVPEALRLLLDIALKRRRRGLLVVSGRRSSVERELMFKAALLATCHEGPVALVLSSYDGEIEEHLEVASADSDPKLRRSRRFPYLPLFPSVASAYESGYRRIACWGDLADGDLLKYVNDVCFVICAHGAEAKEAFSLGTGAGQHASLWDLLEGVIAVLSWGTLRGKRGRFPIYDAYVPTRDPIDRNLHEAVWEGLHAHRQLRWEQQVHSLLAAGEVSCEDVRCYLSEHEVIFCDETDEWQRVSTAKGLQSWLAAHDESSA